MTEEMITNSCVRNYVAEFNEHLESSGDSLDVNLDGTGMIISDGITIVARMDASGHG